MNVAQLALDSDSWWSWRVDSWMKTMRARVAFSKIITSKCGLATKRSMCVSSQLSACSAHSGDCCCCLVARSPAVRGAAARVSAGARELLAHCPFSSFFFPVLSRPLALARTPAPVWVVRRRFLAPHYSLFDSSISRDFLREKWRA